MYLRLGLLVLLTVIAQGDIASQKPSNGSTASYVCNLAKVKAHVEQRGYARIQSGPGAQFRTIDRLPSGKNMYICDEQGGWFKVSYSGLDKPCGQISKDGLNVQKTKDCRSGWIEKKWINVISG